MSGSFQKKTTNIFLTIFIGFIVISFMFTGYESMRGTPDTIAVVGDQKVSFREYQSEYNRQIEFYSQFAAGGKALSSKDIENFRIKENALKTIVNKRLATELGMRLGVTVPSEEIKKSVKEQEIFQTGGTFNIEQYKAILRANQLTPIDYEESVTKEIITAKTNKLLNTYPISNQYLKDIQEFKSQKVSANIVRISKDEIANLLDVKNSEVTAFLADSTNEGRVRSIFSERKSSLDRQESVVAKHILLRQSPTEKEADLKKRIEKIASETNAKNFTQMAKKYTEEPGGKEKGGSLGSFTRGRMVKEFEDVAFTTPVGSVSKPVKTQFGYHLILVESKVPAKEATFDNHKNELAKELLRKQKTEEAATLVKDVANQVEAALAKNDTSTLKKLQTRWKLNYETKVEINRYDGVKGQIFLETKQLSQVFAHKKPALDRFETASFITLVQSTPDTSKAATVDMKQEAQSMRLAYSSKLRQEMLTKLGDDVSVRVHDNRIP